MQNRFMRTIELMAARRVHLLLALASLSSVVDAAERRFSSARSSTPIPEPASRGRAHHAPIPEPASRDRTRRGLGGGRAGR